MDYICESIYNGINYIKNAIPEDSYVGNIVWKTAEIAKGVFYGTVPHLINMSPLYLSKVTNFRIFSYHLLLYKIYDEVTSQENLFDTAISVGAIAPDIIAVMDMFGFIPLEMEYRLTVDSILIMTSAVRSGFAIYEGLTQINSSLSAEDTTSRVSHFVSGTILTTLGTKSLRSCFNVSLDTLHSLGKLNAMDSQEKLHILKNRAISTLGKEKPCTAVIIDGDFHSDSFLNFQPYPMGEFLYETCETRTYVVENSEQFCDALKNANNYFDKPIDVISLQGHANATVHRIGKDYYFRAGQQEVECLSKATSPEAQIFLLGCSTAPSLTDKLSNALPGKEVNGYRSVYNSMSTTSHYIDGKFHHDHYLPFSSVETKTSH